MIDAKILYDNLLTSRSTKIGICAPLIDRRGCG